MGSHSDGWHPPSEWARGWALTRPAVKTRKIRGPQIHKHTQFDQIKCALEVLPMGHKILKRKQKVLVLEKGHWWNKMTVGISHLA